MKQKVIDIMCDAEGVGKFVANPDSANKHNSIDGFTHEVWIAFTRTFTETRMEYWS